MDTLQFALFFAALLVAYVLVHIRLVRFEAYLKEVSALRGVNERLQGLVDALSRVDLTPVEERLDLVHAELRRMLESSTRLEHIVARRREQPAAVAATSSEASPMERIRALVETRLLSLGYHNLRILTDLSSATLAEELEITVECQKGQMVHKGKVVTGNGEIHDVDLQSIVQTFP